MEASKQIIKRDGRKEKFEEYKVQQAVEKAYTSSQTEYNQSVVDNVLDKIKDIKELHVEQVQDAIEQELMKAGSIEAARSFIKHRFIHKLQREQVHGLEHNNTLVDCKQTVEEYIGNKDWRIKANSNTTYSNAGLVNNTAGKIIANYWLDQVYTPEEGAAHRNGDYHIHDLDCLTGYCAGWSLRNLLNEGFNGVRSRANSRPPHHFREALGQMANFLGILQSEWAGAQAFSSFDTYLAPYVFRDKLSYNEVKKALRSFVYNLNVPSRWGQSPFTNVTIDWTVPRDLREQPPFSGGAHLLEGITDKELEEKAKERGCEKLTAMTYKHFQPEMNVIQKAFYEVLTEGDSTGQPFTFPIPTVNITEDFDWEGENVPLLFENAAKIGSSYFQNFIGSQYKYDENGNKVIDEDAYKPDAVRSMCPLTHDTEVIVKNLNTNTIEVRSILDIFIEQSNNNIQFKSFYNGEWSSCHAINVGNQCVYTLHLENGICCRMGENHLQLVRRSGKDINVKAKEIRANDLIPVANISLENNELTQSNIAYVPIYNIEIDNNYIGCLYCLEVDNDSHLFTLANGMITHNCRLQLDLRELLKRGGGLFGSAEMTGSIGVVTINMARLGYLYKGNKNLLYAKLGELMDLAKSTLEKKRVFITELYERGLFPYTKRYLPHLRNHFSTIGLNGVNEMLRNFSNDTMNTATPEGIAFAEEVLHFMRERIRSYQEQTGNLYNLEATPAEGTTHRFAREDLKRFPDIIQAGSPGHRYYTNSSQLPVNYTHDLFKALKMQDKLQCCYTGGTVFHMYMNEAISSPDACRDIVRKVLTNFKMPYITVTPLFSVCEKHGYLKGRHDYCPLCDEEVIEAHIDEYKNR